MRVCSSSTVSPVRSVAIVEVSHPADDADHVGRRTVDELRE
jgi:hypothetical protein